MKNNKVIKKIMLCGFITLMSTSVVLANDSDLNNKEAYTISEKYKFQIQTGTDDWEKLKTTDEMIKVTQIPESYLKNMTTEALVETVLDYPLLGNIYVYNSSDEALTLMAKQFNGMKELLDREDGISLLFDRYSEMKKNREDNGKALELEWILSTETALKELNDNKLASLSSLSERVSYSTEARGSCTIRTQKGSCVNAVTPSEISNAEKNRINNAMAIQYPQAKRISTASARYNCHSYAYYSESTSNKYWVNIPTPFFNDGSFKLVFSKKNRVRGYYHVANHSAIFMNASTVKGKWGTAGVYQHAYNYGPYTTAGLSLYSRYDLK